MTHCSGSRSIGRTKRCFPNSQKNVLAKNRMFSSETFPAGQVTMEKLLDLCVAAGQLDSDPAQKYVANRLSKIQARLFPYEVELLTYRESKSAWEAEKQRIMKSMDEKRRNDSNSTDTECDESEVVRKLEETIPKPVPPMMPRGMYIYGNVGTGKTVLMDMFYETTNITRKRRVHFHEFMIEVHQRIHKWKMERLKTKGRDLHINLSSEADAIVQVARMISNESILLAFDEFVVTDCADALMMRNLFDELFSQGTVVIATSNTAPEDLYYQGLNRHYFLPFIDTLKRYCKPHDMETKFDYRLKKADAVDVAASRYVSPLGRDADAYIEEKFEEFGAGKPLLPKVIDVAFGRTLAIEKTRGDAALFDFYELCDGRLPAFGPADFKAVCDNFEYIFVKNVPELGEENHNEARRFVTFIDQVYDRRRKLFLSAAKSFDELCIQNSHSSAEESNLLSVKELKTAMRRMSSRLGEMQNPHWPDA